MMGMLPQRDEPLWLSRLTAESIQNGPFPLREILRSSLYYPASRFDGDPVKYLAGHIHSFVYVDYGEGKEAFERALLTEGFKGYRLLGKRAVLEKALTSRDWDPDVLPPEYRPPDEFPEAYGAPFCTWIVLERLPDFDDDHGPARFSLLYWCHEGVSAFLKLYFFRGIAPRAVAIIRSDYGFGGNWTTFADPNEILAQVILNNPAGQPKLLLFGGHLRRNHYREPCWTDYRKCLGFLPKAGGGSIGLWERETRQGRS